MSRFTVQPVIKEEEPLTVLLYGPSGSGKTSLAATVCREARFGNVLVLDTDRGLSALPNLPNLFKVDASDIDVLREVIVELSLPVERRDPALQNVHTIIFDSLSSFKDATLRNIVNSNDVRSDKGKSLRFKFPEQREYGMLVYEVGWFLQYVQSSGLNAVYISGAKMLTNEAGYITNIPFDLNAGIAAAVPYRVSYIFGALYSDEGYSLSVLPQATQSIPFTIIKARNNAVVEKLNALTKGTGILYPTMGDDGLPSWGLDNLYRMYIGEE